MPTIKTKKEINLPQLIEWGWKNEIEKRSFISNDGKVTANFEDMGHFITDSYISKDVTFTVEIEEEITEDTVIPKMLEKSFDAYQNVVLDIQVNQSINTVKENAEVLTLHVINDDDTHTLIWRDGKLVE